MAFSNTISMKRFFLVCLAFSLLTFEVSSQEKPDALVTNTAQHYKTLSTDGAWCWFSDPRAVYLNNKVYSGWVSADGSIMVGSYNEQTGETREVNLYPQFNKDDHANPSFLVLPDKRLMVFFSAHSVKGRGEKEPAISYATTKNPEDITEWEPLQRLTQNSEGDQGFCYTNPIMLSEENNRIYLFWRGADWKPTFSYSDDLGQTWSKVFSLMKSTELAEKRPYIKITSNGKDEIHFAFTDGHPRNEPLNSIYYLKYKAGKFTKADGTELGGMESLPLSHQATEMVYDAAADFKETAFAVRSWIWDVAVSNEGRPTIVYTKLPTESEHRYWYAQWTGTEWRNSKISNAGAWFTRYPKNKSQREPEPHYSGGVYLDHENTNTVYYSKPVGDIFEIFKAETADKGETWTETAITSHSKKDNVRPYAILGADKNAASQILWMMNDRYSGYWHYNAQIKLDAKKEKPSPALTKVAVKQAMQKVAHWQVNEPLHHHTGDWTNGALYAGMVEWAKMADDSLYFDYLRDKGDQLRWARLLRPEPGYRYFADDYVVGQMYVEMFRTFKEDKMIKPMEWYFDFMLKHPSDRSLAFNWDDRLSYPVERWSWCDALFMGPTVWAKMSNELNRLDYLAFMHNEYTFTYDYLYDQEEHLFFRDDRYFDKREANGKEVFWGRGNGWVIAGLPIILQEVPAKWEHRKFYEKLFKEMAEKIASLQDENGYWHASLLDPESYPMPETSSSAFFTYALAWGVNNGYLKKEDYLPVVEKGWQALVKAVYPDGRLGWVQPVGQDPKTVTRDMTEVYGVGAFLLAGKELYKMTK